MRPACSGARPRGPVAPQAGRRSSPQTNSPVHGDPVSGEGAGNSTRGRVRSPENLTAKEIPSRSVGILPTSPRISPASSGSIHRQDAKFAKEIEDGGSRMKKRSPITNNK